MGSHTILSLTEELGNWMAVHVKPLKKFDDLRQGVSRSLLACHDLDQRNVEYHGSQSSATSGVDKPRNPIKACMPDRV